MGIDLVQLLTAKRQLYYTCWIAKVAELVDALDLGSSAVRCGGSSPPFRTTFSA